MSDIIVVLRYSNKTAFDNRMKAIELSERTFDEGKYCGLMRWRRGNATVSIDEDNGNEFISIRFNSDSANKFPPDNNPAFALVWRSDENSMAEWPTYSVEDIDEDGNGLGTYHQQLVGGLA